MPTIDEKRVYTDNSGTETVYLATGLGVVAVSVSDDLIGEFGVAERCHARDVATAGPLVAVATDEDVLVADRSAADGDAASTAGPSDALDFAATGFGPATAVGFDAGALLAGDEEGRIGRCAAPDDAASDADATWTEVGSAGAVRAIDGGLVAAADGVYRVDDSGATHAGLNDARDVDAEPLVATGSGLFKLGNGWMDVLSDPVDAVDAVGPRAHAVSEGTLYARDPDADTHEEAWHEEALPIDSDVVAVTHGAESSYAVTADGTLAVRLEGDEWRHRGLGVRDVAAAAV
ncbi:hypothetical protein [Halobellus sp. H-GB7]|uniref:HVO_0234 family beta-propeller protein n=1 Tax=Halobellus sp. H-GB7 TaxID=3069756 RepID=UPI0027B14E17|nr:hypothetical protein [Halobellus sp. H-GB7]MDQ2056001.1 hypothetical protein [Halobellus sp. H-GB7]